jgi:hypothetical protein
MNLKKLFILVTSLVFGCKTEEPQNPPTVITKVASDVTFNVATLNGEVTDEGFSATTDRGFVFSEKNTNPTGNDSRVQVGFGKGVYSIVLDKLTVNTKYYYKAYATNTKGISFGEVQSFTTADYKLPMVSSDSPIEINYFSVVINGTVTDEGGSLVTERGICYSLNPNPTISENKVIAGTGKGSFITGIYNLKDNSKYFYRAYAINIKGISYGIAKSFNTLDASNGFRDTKTKVVEVKSKTGRIWMDRNLGASQAATSMTDKNAIGDLYQWGRGADGHQLRTSPTTYVQVNSDVPGHDYFIATIDNYVPNWRIPNNDNLWQGANGVNNPCPVGFRLPTASEWDLERLSWSSNNRDGAFASPLKLPIAAERSRMSGTILFSDYSGTAWSSTIDNRNSYNFSFAFYYDRNTATIPPSGVNRAEATTVRCIKD